MHAIHFHVVDIHCPCGSDRSFRDCHGVSNPEASWFPGAADRLLRHCIQHSLPANQHGLYRNPTFAGRLQVHRRLMFARAGMLGAALRAGMDDVTHAGIDPSGTTPQLPLRFSAALALDLDFDDGDVMPQGLYEVKVREWEAGSGYVSALEFESGDSGENVIIDQDTLFATIRDNRLFVDSIFMGMQPVLMFSSGDPELDSPVPQAVSAEED
jgi:hypothetical protein